MVEWLKLRAFYRQNMRQLSAELQKEEADLSGEIHQGDILNYLYSQEIKEDLHHLRMAYEQLGIHLGESVPEEWLNELSPVDRNIFRMRFEEKRRYSDIANQMSLPMDVVRHHFNQSLEEVMKKAGGE